jgi:hypothetical protein
LFESRVSGRFMKGSCMKLDEMLSIFILAVFLGSRLLLRLDKTS